MNCFCERIDVYKEGEDILIKDKLYDKNNFEVAIDNEDDYRIEILGKGKIKLLM
jgi:hypothetical protein